MDRTESARRYFAADLYATEVTGIRIDRAEGHYARCSLALGPQHRNANHQVMGGVIFTLADFTFAVAANDDPDYITVSLNSQIQFLSTVRGQSVVAETRCLKYGRTTCVMEITVSDDTGHVVGHVVTTGLRNRKPQAV